MKRVLSLAAILLVIAAIIGCEKLEPQAPTLIEPEDGAVFDTLPPTFIWSSDEFADDYVIRIYMGSSTDIQDTLSDTTYSMSKTLFETLLNGTYNWLAATMSEGGELFWSESRSFVIDKSEEPQGLDLDTTYFPFGLGYEWCYERHSSYRHSYEPDKNYDTYDTFTIDVFDYCGTDNTLTYEYTGGEFRDIDNPVIIKKGIVEIRLHGCLSDIYEISVTEPDTFSHEEPHFSYRLTQSEDTLLFSGYYDDMDFSGYAVWESVHRIRDLGVLLQSGSSSYEGIDKATTSDRLLWFYNGQDTVYKAK